MAFTGGYHTPEDCVTRALETLEQRELQAVIRTRTPARVVAHIRESRKGITPGGLKIKDLLAEGRKY